MSGRGAWHQVDDMRKGSQFDVMIAAMTRTLAKIGSPALWKVDLERGGRNLLQSGAKLFPLRPYPRGQHAVSALIND